MITAGIQQEQTFQKKYPGLNSKYLLYLPKEYDENSAKRWPFIFFLHGAGERGNNLNRVLTQGLPKLLYRHADDFPFIVASPQCTGTTRWASSTLNAALDEIVKTYKTDTDRIYLTGLSMGGFGTWALAIAQPSKFAAIAPICGGGDVSKVCAIKDLPVWTFHGVEDDIVPIEYTEMMVEALEKCGGKVLFTVYPKVGHDSWTQTYNNPQLYDWFLENIRGAYPKK